MDSIFLSYSFSKPEDRLIVMEIDDVFRSLDLRPLTGLNLGGEQLDAEVQNLIRQTDGLVALASRRERKDNGGWTTHDWITGELNFGRFEEKPSVALVEDGVELGGFGQLHEYIPFDRDNLDPAMLKLAKTLGVWKRKAGKRLKIRLLPDALADELPIATFRYQYVFRGDQLGWKDVKPVLEPGGIFVHLSGARDGYLIEVEVDNPQRASRRSPATAQTTPVQVE